MTIDRKRYLHQRKTIFRILDLLKDFVENNSADLGPTDEMDADEASIVSHHYDTLVDYMAKYGAHDREIFDPEPEGGPAEAAVEVEAEPAARPDAPGDGEAVQGSVCAHCGAPVAPERADSPDGVACCGACWPARYFTCEQCGDYAPRAVMRRADDGSALCPRCFQPNEQGDIALGLSGKIVFVLARAIAVEVEGNEIDEANLRLAAENLARAAMAIRGFTREEIRASGNGALARMLEIIVGEAKENHPEMFQKQSAGRCPVEASVADDGRPEGDVVASSPSFPPETPECPSAR